VIIKDPKKAELVRKLIKQPKHEEMILTASGQESFDHPTGRHNDMGISLELSIYGCIQMGLKIDLPGNHVGSQIIDTLEINYGIIQGQQHLRTHYKFRNCIVRSQSENKTHWN